MTNPTPTLFSPLPVICSYCLLIITFFIFDHEDHHHLMRCVVAQDGQIWFVAQVICLALKLTNIAQSFSRMDAEEKGFTSMNTIYGTSTLSTVNEAGFYALTLCNRKHAVKVFKTWVTYDFLRAIRCNDLYIRRDEKLLIAAIPDQLRERLQEN